MKNEKIISGLNLTIYNKGGQTWYCDYYFFNGINYEMGTTKASGYGYDKQSTAASEAINKFKFLYNIKQGTKWNYKTDMHPVLKNGASVYGIYKDKHISYGIGISSVLNCLQVFSNVKKLETHFGEKSITIRLEIKNSKKQLEKIIEKNQQIIDNKKATKEDRKAAKEINKKIFELFEIKEA